MKTLALICLCLLAAASLPRAQAGRMDSLTHDDLTRRYALYAPPGAGGPRPLVVFLHGGGGNALSAQGFTQFNASARAHGFVAAYPQGFASIDDDDDSYVWADGRGTAADQQGIDDAGFILRLVDTLAASGGIDTGAVYLCGFSNGGFMTQRLACERDDKFAAFASVGSIMDTARIRSCDPERPLPMLLLMATADPFAPYEGGEMPGARDVLPVVSAEELAAFWRARNQCADARPVEALPDLAEDDGSTISLFVYEGCACGAETRFYRAEGAGHTWPGVELPNYEIIAGETNEDVHAAELLWAFFRRFRRPCPYDGAAARTEYPAPEARFRLVPNPANGRAVVVSAVPVERTRLYDMQGRLVAESGGPELDLAGLPAGVYCARIRDRSGAVAARKLFVR